VVVALGAIHGEEWVTRRRLCFSSTGAAVRPQYSQPQARRRRRRGVVTYVGALFVGSDGVVLAEECSA
jgi:hypothetical protein